VELIDLWKKYTDVSHVLTAAIIRAMIFKFKLFLV
jgi:hypothetical protein